MPAAECVETKIGPGFLPGNASHRVATLSDLLGVELGTAGVAVGDQHLRVIGRADRPPL